MLLCCFYQGHVSSWDTLLVHATHIWHMVFVVGYGVPVASLRRQVITCVDRLYSNMQDMAMVR